jgi:hypothetical protein
VVIDIEALRKSVDNSYIVAKLPKDMKISGQLEKKGVYVICKPIITAREHIENRDRLKNR